MSPKVQRMFDMIRGLSLEELEELVQACRASEDENMLGLGTALTRWLDRRRAARVAAPSS